MLLFSFLLFFVLISSLIFYSLFYYFLFILQPTTKLTLLAIKSSRLWNIFKARMNVWKDFMVSSWHLYRFRCPSATHQYCGQLLYWRFFRIFIWRFRVLLIRRCHLLCVGSTFIEYPAWFNLINCIMDHGLESRKVGVSGSCGTLWTSSSNSLSC